MKTYKFYDTNALLLKGEALFETDELFAISSITLNELEGIKTSSNKDAQIKYEARHILRLLDEHPNCYDIQIFKNAYLEPMTAKDVEINNDTKILACALAYDTERHPDETVFVTNDLALKAIANLFFGTDSIESVDEDNEDEYSGYKEVHMTNEDMVHFYSNPTTNAYDLLINEYLILYNEENEVIDRLCWTGKDYRHLNYSSFRSKHFGEIKALSGDTFQQLACDSLSNNKITMLKGPAGTGKSILALGYLFNQLERGRIDHIIVFCNTVATKGAAKLGFYPGSKNEKLLDSQIGNMLASKVGDRVEVERLIEQEKLILIPASDCRGYDTSGMRAGVYITEAQNLDRNLMKLMLQRIGEDSICIIDGDAKTQVDDVAFAGSNNGMRRASQVFRGESLYGEVELKNIHRSAIARIAEFI